MAVIRQLLFRAACGGYRHVILHVRGVDNAAADALSRGNVAAFRRLLPDAAARPAPSPTGGRHTRDPARAAHLLTGVRL